MAFSKSHAYDSEKYKQVIDLDRDSRKELAASGDPYALTILAADYREEDSEEAYEPSRSTLMLQTAAGQGFAPAQIMLGESYRDGIGVTANKELAVAWLQKAAQQGATAAYLVLGLIYLEEAKTETAGVELLLQAAEEDDPNAMLIIGDLYRTGEFVEQDLFEAFKWIQRSAAKNNEDAQVEMARMLLLGEGCGQDYITGVDILTKLAEADHPEALYLMHVVCADGLGVEPDAELARQYLERAASLGHHTAIVRLAELGESQ